MKGGDPVSGLQKAVCLFLSVCFVAVLVITPGPFWPGENIYRQFPLYCFLEDSALGQQQKDQETYQLLMENNGEYLGKEIRKENQIKDQNKDQIKDQNKDQNKDYTVDEPVETPNPTEPTEAPTETPNPTEPAEAPAETPNPTESTEEPAEIPESTEKPEEDHKEVASVSADIKPAPVLDLSPEILADQDYLMNHFFIVDEGTTADAVQLNAASFLREDFSLKKDQNVPQILIYHSHSQEAFADSREGMEEDTILGVGDYLTEILTEQYKYQVLHVREAFDMKSGELDRSKAYDYAREYLEPVLAENENIQVVIDLHRDGVPEDRKLVTEVNGKPTAQILFYNGLSYTNQSGSLEYLPNPYIQDNLAFSFQLEYEAAEYYPDFYRGIYLAGYRYNLHMRPRSILLEAGAQTNTVQEVKNAMEPFADILNRVLEKNITGNKKSE